MSINDVNQQTIDISSYALLGSNLKKPRYLIYPQNISLKCHKPQGITLKFVTE